MRNLYYRHTIDTTNITKEMEANPATREFESLMLQRGGCAQDREKPQSPHAQGAYTAQHIPITHCNTPQKISLGISKHRELAPGSHSAQCTLLGR